MAKNNRTGNRKSRDKRSPKRIPDMGYYLVVTNTKGTERCYFEGLYKTLPIEMNSRLVINVFETKTNNLIEKCLELVAYQSQYRIPWIIFDRDQVKDFDSIIKEANDADICVGWSNPCFEIWMYGYFGNVPVIENSWNCCEKFANIYKKKTGLEYSKTNENLYTQLCKFGDEQNALKQAQLKYKQYILNNKEAIPSKMLSCTTVDILVAEINNKIKSIEKNA